MIKILIVNQARLICSVLTAVLREEPDIRVIGYATTQETARKKAPQADVVLLDTGWSDGETLELTQWIARTQPQTHILITGIEKHAPEKILMYVEAGADGYVPKEVSVEDLLENIRAVQADKALFPPEMVAKLIARVNELADMCADQEQIANVLRGLTPRERDVLDLVTDGLSNQEIGEKLHIEVGTVKNHVHKILRKLDVTNRDEAAEMYMRAQAATLDDE
ncbi:MAG: response regulator transcription factor [Anaerolineales bacterium]|nr:response regulator transcription factor [Anaerolineales bacterium]